MHAKAVSIDSYDKMNVRSAEGNQGNVIPVIDLSSWVKATNLKPPDNDEQRRQVVKAVKEACEEIGFFVVQNHGLNETSLKRVWEAVGAFFDLPLQQKLEYRTDNEAEYPYGYEHSERLTLGKERDRNNKSKTEEQVMEGLDHNLPPPDPKETFSIGPSNPLSGMPTRRYPTLPGMKEALDDGYQELENLAMILLRIFAVALNLPEQWFENKMDRHMCALRALNYPPILLNNDDRAAHLPLTIRAGEHTDYGVLTILKSGGPGLQAKKDNNQGDWIDVPQEPGALIINLGDLMQRWTNGKSLTEANKFDFLSSLEWHAAFPPCDLSLYRDLFLPLLRSLDFYASSSSATPRWPTRTTAVNGVFCKYQW